MSRRLIRKILWASMFTFIIGLIGFVFFTLRVERQPAQINSHADGMIVLTGGADRVTDAINLFGQGHADRMLITGVNPGITRAEIANLNPKYRELVDCCVDLGYEALNTFGNAREARRWVEDNKIAKSIIVVTSNYHMPRALAELHAALPAHRLIPYSVISLRMRDGNWWQSSQALRLMGTEYVKFIAVSGRILAAKIWMRAKEAITRPSN